MCNKGNFKNDQENEENELSKSKFPVLPEEEILLLTPEQKERYYAIFNEENDNVRETLIAKWNEMDEKKRKERIKTQR